MHEIVTIIAQYFIAFPVLAYLYVLYRATNSERKQLVIRSAVSLVVTFLIVKLATSTYHDPRPFIRDHVTPYFKSSTDNGFPSDHTTYSTLLAWLVFSRSRTLGVILLVIALLVGTARVIAGVHHGVDIVGGFLLASLGFWASWFAVRAFAASRKTAEK